MTGRLALLRIMLFSILEALGVTFRKVAGRGTANTALVFHSNKLMVLHEGDVPHEVRMLEDAVLETVGAQFYNGGVCCALQITLHHVSLLCHTGKLSRPFTAHPKIDPETGYMYAFGYDVSTVANL
jgi:carotenoid cleavage dioxygenase